MRRFGRVCINLVRHIPLPTKKRGHCPASILRCNAILPFPASGNPRQKFACGKLTIDGNKLPRTTLDNPANKKERVLPYTFSRFYAILPFPASGNPRQKFACGKLTIDGNKLPRTTLDNPANEKERAMPSLFRWQGRRDSNTQPTVLETATLPLSHSPIKPVYFTIIKNESQEFLIVFSILNKKFIVKHNARILRKSLFTKFVILFRLIILALFK